MRIVITHVGNTAIECAAIKDPLRSLQGNNVPSDYTRKVQHIKKGQQRTDRLVDEWSTALQTGLREIWKSTTYTEPEKLEKSPAEIASLSLMDLDPGDRVVLVHSETVAGEFCAKLLHACLSPQAQPSPPPPPPAAPAAPSGAGDYYARYERGVEHLLAQLGRNHARYNDVLTYQARLDENIYRTRQFGNTEREQSGRAEILHQLNVITLSELDQPFNLLYKVPAAPDANSATTSQEPLADTNSSFRTPGLDVAAIERLPDVAAHDTHHFLKTGLNFYMQIVAAEYKLAVERHATLCFNVTAGYKGLVPFAVMAAQLLGDTSQTRWKGVPTEVVYVHEDSYQSTTQPIDLTFQLPIEWHRLREAYPAIRTLVDSEGKSPARALARDTEGLDAYLDKKNPGSPSALALAIYFLVQELGEEWLG